jgi:hypothetical protein
MIPIMEPTTPHTGMITSLVGQPPAGSTFESVWGANEAEVVQAYQTFLYDVPGPGATPEEWQAYNDAIRPFTSMIFADPSRLLEWKPGPDGEFTLSGPIYKFSDPVRIGTIEGQFTSGFQTVVPEPASVVLAVLGALGAVLMVRRRGPATA